MIRLYHLSYKHKLKSTLLCPRIPYSSVIGYEDTVTPRVCMSDSIDGCLTALQCNPGTYHVYFTDIDKSDPKLHYPTPEEVFDAFMTHEVWITAPIQLEYKGMIFVDNSTLKSIEMNTLYGALIDTFYYRTCKWSWL